ncbi:MAG: hypothetical protein L3J95_04740 [Thermoplasmata archaeon]|nr:hypothetical protein [Thermoplasmata archaeon]
MADLITGMAAFSVIILSSFWFFSIGWLTLTQEYAARGVTFGSPAQSGLAWIGVLVALPLVAPTLYLALRAYRLPYSLFRSITTGLDHQVGAGHPPTPSIGSRLRRRWATLRRPRLP